MTRDRSPAARRRARAFSLVEILISSVVLMGALVPMYFLFTGSSKNVFRSRVSYMAMHAAREELEALRQVPPSKLLLMRHDWEAVKGTILRRTTVPGDPAAALPAGATLNYPQEYERIETKLAVSSNTDVDEAGQAQNLHCYRVLLQVRWQEMGKSEDEGGKGHRTALSRFQTVIADLRVK